MEKATQTALIDLAARAKKASNTTELSQIVADGFEALSQDAGCTDCTSEQGEALPKPAPKAKTKARGAA